MSRKDATWKRQPILRLQHVDRAIEALIADYTWEPTQFEALSTAVDAIARVLNSLGEEGADAPQEGLPPGHPDYTP